MDIFSSSLFSTFHRAFIGRGLYIIFGKSGTFSNINASTLDGTNGGFIISGVGSSGFGYTVSGAGDINGDGHSDLIVGAYAANKAYVIFGKIGAFSNINATALNGTNGGFIIAVAGSAGFGVSSSSIGDIDGDGHSDLIVGAYTANKAYVIFGKSSIFSNIDATALNGMNGGFIINGASSSSFGVSSRGIGDINGDGYPDLIIGAASFSSPGKAYVIFGKNGTFSNIDATVLTGSNGGFIISNAGPTGFGFTTAGIGDINGDSYLDLIVGDDSTSSGNKAYVIFGKSGTFSNIDATTLTGSNGGFIISGASSTNFGRSSSGIADINGDRYPDFIVGADTGSKAYVIFGKGCDFPNPVPSPELLPQPTPAPFPELHPVPYPQPAPSPEPAPQFVPYPELTPQPLPHPFPEPEPQVWPAPFSLPQLMPTPSPEPKSSPTPIWQPTPVPQPSPKPSPVLVPEPMSQPVHAPFPTPAPQPSLHPHPAPTPINLPTPHYKCTCNTKAQVEKVKLNSVCSGASVIYKCAEPDVGPGQAYCIGQIDANSVISIYHIEEFGTIKVHQDPMI